MDTVVGESVELDVTLNTITFHAPDTGYTVARATVADSDQFTIVGTMIDPHPGISLRVTGTWDTHPKYGTQLKLAGLPTTVTPTDAPAIEAFLASGIVAGIGPATAHSIVEHFGAATLDIMATNPDALLAISGIGPKTLAKITDSYGKQKGIQDLMLILAKAGIAPGLAGKIWKHFEDKATWVVQQAPYQLTDVPGIGFTTADAVARKLGIDPRDPERVKAGMLHVLDEASGNGHCYLPMNQLINDTVALLDVPTDLAIDAYTALTPDKIIDDGDRSWLSYMWLAEVSVADHLTRLYRRGFNKKLSVFATWDDTKWDEAVADAGLADAQAAAVRAALKHPISVLTGGPGCGKTYTVNTIVNLAASAGASIGLAAPTGRAAKRMEEQCGRPASTIHRMLGLQGDDDVDEQPLEGDVFIIDESSMLDIHLANKLLKMIPAGAHIVFVGDEDQLPSVGPGKFLSDLIASGAVPVTRLTQVFRQAAESGIVQIAHAVNQGTMKPEQMKAFDDIYWWPTERVDDKIIDMVCNRIPETFGIATCDVQVLAPMKKGVEGVDALNTRLQDTMNPSRPYRDEHTIGDRVFRVGDRVMQTRNNYDKNIFNGTPALIDAIGDDGDGGTKITIVTDDGEAIDYEPSELSQLMHAYAITIHKSQGSEYPAVVIPVTTAAWIMWRRNLLYTAITRAKQLVVLLGDPRALEQAVRKLDTSTRNTALAERLE